jgi:hypothetical protein
MKSALEFIDMDREELNRLVERARAALSAEEHRKLKGVVEALTYLTDLVADQQTTIGDLRELLFPASTERQRQQPASRLENESRVRLVMGETEPKHIATRGESRFRTKA